MNKKSPTFWVVVILLGVAVSLFLVPEVVAQEHPKEHPTADQSEEHPAEHPVKKASAELTKENLATAIHDFVTAESKKSDGTYKFVDEEKEKTLKLTLKKVHKERLATLGNDTYFACADFSTKDGKIYDLDIFMKGKSAEELVPTEVTLHKEEGVERYTWSESKGVWKKVPVKKSKKVKNK